MSVTNLTSSPSPHLRQSFFYFTFFFSLLNFFFFFFFTWVIHAVAFEVAMIDGNIYHYCDYNKKGALVQAYERSGERGLRVEFKLMIPFMYCSGKGVTLKEIMIFNQPPAETLQSRGTKSRLQTDVSNGLVSRNSVETAGDHRINLPTETEQLTHTTSVKSCDLTRKVCWKLGFRGLYGEVRVKKTSNHGNVLTYTPGSLCYMFWSFATLKFTRP